MRWLPGTRILTWVDDGVGTSEPSVAGVRSERRRGATVPRSQDRAAREAELVEPAPEVLGAATHDRGEDPEVVVADREHLPVEVLTLELDRRGVARDHRGVVVVDLVEPHEVDGEAVDPAMPTAR